MEKVIETIRKVAVTEQGEMGGYTYLPWMNLFISIQAIHIRVTLVKMNNKMLLLI